MKKNLSYLITALLFVSQLAISQNTGYSVKNFIKIGGEPKWDYLFVDNMNNKLFVSHNSEVNIINILDNTIAGTVPGLKGVHGIAPADEFGKAYISEGSNNSIAVIDLKTFKLLKEIKCDGKKPDAIYYDTYSKKVLVSNNGSNSLSVIDPKTDMIINTITLDGAPESIVSDLNGKIYVNIEDKTEVQVIDINSLKVINSWSLSPAETPTGISIDVNTHRLFVGCRSKHGVVINTENGKIIISLPIAGGVDACCFDPGTKNIFFSCKDGVISVISEKSPDVFTASENIKTEKGSKTMALDLKSHIIYASTAIEPGKELSSDGKPLKTFGVLVIGR